MSKQMSFNNAAQARRFSTLGAVSTIALAISLGSAAVQSAEARQFKIESQPLSQALLEYSEQSEIVVVVSQDVVRGKTAPAIEGSMEPEEALTKLLDGSGLKYRESDSGVFTVTLASATLGEEATPSPFRVAQVDQAAVTQRLSEDEDFVENDAIQDVVVVTGTRLRGVAPESQPVVVLDRADIDASGFTTVEGFLRTLPQNTGSGVSQESFRASGAGADPSDQGAGLNLRGLGQRATLVLINGRRVAPGGVNGGFVDVSLIPLSAVERVEVLTTGASAIYGSDAVGGVVNFILRDNFEGAETTLRFGSPTNGDGDEFVASQALGTSWAGGNAVLSYEYRSVDEVLAGDRDFTIGLNDQTLLFPEEERHSLFGILKQELTDRLTIEITGQYSSRETVRDILNEFNILTSADAETEVFSFGAEANYEISSTWLLSAAASISENDRSVLDVAEDASLTRDSDRTSKTEELTLTLAGDSFSLPGGTVKTVFGAQYRSLETTTDIELTGAPDFTRDAETDSYALFAEVLLPVFSNQNAVQESSGWK